MTNREPSYISLYKKGELALRAERLALRLRSCDICPHNCRVNRWHDELGFCKSGRLPVVSSVCTHYGEEPVISGSRGSGTIFFGNCNMRCKYCQNYQISQDWEKQKSNQVNCKTLAEKMMYLQNDMRCHNINFVSPSHFVPQVVQAITEAVPMGLCVPIVYNSNGYDSVDTLKELEGIVDIYLPDLRYASDVIAEKYSLVSDYVYYAQLAIKEMYRQVGNLIMDVHGVAEKGLIIRHLILPNNIAGTKESLAWVAKELSVETTVSVMSQYQPMHLAKRSPLLSRNISVVEHEKVVRLLDQLGLENGWIQEMGSAEHYLPDFNREGHPFS
jgi:putative pyruvate formate lyase activating enzyme